MFTSTALLSLAPVGRRLATSAAGSFIAGGPVGMGSLGRRPSGLGNLGIVPVIVAAAGAAGSAAGGYFAADAAKAQAAASVDIAQEQAIALAAPSRYAFKTAKHQFRLDRFALTVDAVSGKTVNLTKDRTGLVIAIGLGVAVIAGGFLLMKGV